MVRLAQKRNGCREDDERSQHYNREEGAESSILKNKVKIGGNITYSKRIRNFHQITQKVKY